MRSCPHYGEGIDALSGYRPERHRSGAVGPSAEPLRAGSPRSMMEPPRATAALPEHVMDVAGRLRRSHGSLRDRRRGGRRRKGRRDPAQRGVRRRRDDRGRRAPSALPAPAAVEGLSRGQGGAGCRDPASRRRGTPSATSSCARPRRRPRSIPPHTDSRPTAGDAGVRRRAARDGRVAPIGCRSRGTTSTVCRRSDASTTRTRSPRELRGGGRRLVLIGSGWIGMEVAATARTLGNEVTVLERDRVPLALAVGPRMGEVFRRLHEENGVDLRTERAGRADRGARDVRRASSSTARPCRPTSC